MLQPGRLVVTTIDTRDLRLEKDAYMAFPQEVDPSPSRLPIKEGEVVVVGLDSSYAAGLLVGVETSPGILEWKGVSLATDPPEGSDGLPYYA